MKGLGDGLKDRRKMLLEAGKKITYFVMAEILTILMLETIKKIPNT